MVLIESSESEDEILIKNEPKPSSSSSPQHETMAPTESKQVDGDDSDGFETASEREISDEEGEEDDRENDAVTNQEPHQSDQSEKKEEEQIALMREGEANDESNQVNLLRNELHLSFSVLLILGLWVH